MQKAREENNIFNEIYLCMPLLNNGSLPHCCWILELLMKFRVVELTWIMLLQDSARPVPKEPNVEPAHLLGRGTAGGEGAQLRRVSPLSRRRAQVQTVSLFWGRETGFLFIDMASFTTVWRHLLILCSFIAPNTIYIIHLRPFDDNMI